MRVPRCALRRAAVLRLLISLLACGDGGGGGGGVRASECCRCRRAWRRRSRRFCCPGRLALTCCCPDGLLGMHCLLACVAACALLWPAGWLAARLRLDTRVCACDRRMRSCARHAAAQRDAGCVTMPCWRHMGRVWPAAGDTALLLLGGCTRTRLLVPHAGWMLRIGGAAWRRAVGARRWRVGTRATTTTAAAVTITITTTTTSTTTMTDDAGGDR